MSQASDVTAELKRKLEKKEKKRKKRDKKLLELQSNGETNGEAEVNVFFSVCASMFWFETWPTGGPFSVYDMPDDLDSEPLAGPISGPDHWRGSHI